MHQYCTPGRSTWKSRCRYRADRFLTVHNQTDEDDGDVDMDVLLYLTAKNFTRRVWCGNPMHSLAPWLHIHQLTPSMWYSQRATDWTLAIDGILETVPPKDKISSLLRSLVLAIHQHHYPTMPQWPSTFEQWHTPQGISLDLLKREMGTHTRILRTPTGLRFYEGDILITVLDSSPIYVGALSPLQLIRETSSWLQVIARPLKPKKN
jgi:hypothetical protein